MTQREQQEIFKERFQKLAIEVYDEKKGEKRLEYRWEMAKRLDISRNTLTQYYNGNRMPDSRILQQICDKCQVSPDYMLGLVDNPTIDVNIKMIAEYTGLDENAINTLHEMKKHHTTLNILLNHESGLDILHLIDIYINIDRSTPIIRNKETNEDEDVEYSDLVYFRKWDGTESDFGIHLGFLTDYIPALIIDEIKQLRKEIGKEMHEETH